MEINFKQENKIIFLRMLRRLLFEIRRLKFKQNFPNGLVYYVHSNKSWVLGNMANDIYKELSKNNKSIHVELISDLPSENCKIFFSHYLDYVKYYKLNKGRISKTVLWFTHYKQDIFLEKEIFEALSHAELIIFQSNLFAADYYFKTENANYMVLPYGTKEYFYENERDYVDENYDVVISTSIYGRKNLSLLLYTAECNSALSFLLITNSDKELKVPSNMKVLKNISHEKYPELYSKSKVLLSISTVEGGPISVSEAYISGLSIIMTNTGYANTICKDPGVFILDDLNVGSINILIRKALKMHNKSVNYSQRDFRKFLKYSEFISVLANEVRKV